MRRFDALTLRPFGGAGGLAPRLRVVHFGSSPLFRFLVCLILGLLGLLLSPALWAAAIDATDKYAWSATAGWVNHAPTGGGVQVYADHLEGHAWVEGIGWIRLGTHTGGGAHTYTNADQNTYGVNRSGTTLSGYAWSPTAGWVHFAPAGGGASLDPATGYFSGYAWGERIGWIQFTGTAQDTTAYRVAMITDTDSDSVPDEEENVVPGLPPAGGGPAVPGDGNGDGTPDANQADVSSLAWATSPDADTRYVTLTNADGLPQTAVSSAPAPADKPADLDLPLGVLAFTVSGVQPGGTVTFSVFIDADLPVNGYYKPDRATGVWVNIADANVLVGNGTQRRLDFRLQDGGPYDGDGQANGVIDDPGGPGWRAAVIPPVNPPVTPPVTPPTPTSARLINLSSRGWVGDGDALMIDGFILDGGDAPRRIVVRALGPTLADAGLPLPLANPKLRVTTVDGQPIAENDDWQQAENALDLEALGLAPPDPREAALLLPVEPRVPYTVLVEGADFGTGTVLVEVLDPDAATPTPRLVNLSSRAWMGEGDDLLIGGLILGGGDAPRQILVRVLGPTLAEAQLANLLENPQITLTTLDGQVLAENDDWTASADAAAIEATGLAPPDPREPALLLTLDPNVPYTVLVRGVNGATGLGLLEILELP